MNSLPIVIYSLAGVWCALFHYYVSMTTFFQEATRPMRLVYGGWMPVALIGVLLHLRVRRSLSPKLRWATLAVAAFPVLATAIMAWTMAVS